MSEDELLRQDEILQLLYWMRGEKIDDEVEPEQLNRFLQLDAAPLAGALRTLCERGLLSQVSGGRYRLTSRGVEEGKRRFADEFTPFLGKENHLECDDPDCDCHLPEFSGTCKHLN